MHTRPIANSESSVLLLLFFFAFGLRGIAQENHVAAELPISQIPDTAAVQVQRPHADCATMDAEHKSSCLLGPS